MDAISGTLSLIEGETGEKGTAVRASGEGKAMEIWVGAWSSRNSEGSKPFLALPVGVGILGWRRAREALGSSMGDGSGEDSESFS
jgi:hypothetical protein